MYEINMFKLGNFNPLTNNEVIMNIIFAIIIILVGFTIGKIVSIIVFKFLNELQFDKGLKKISNSKFHSSKTISSTISLLIYIASVIVALFLLNILNITLSIILYFIILLFIGTLIFGLIFSIPNFLASFKIKKQFKEGDKINNKFLKGEIKRIGFFNTRVNGPNNELFLVPNKILLNK